MNSHTPTSSPRMVVVHRTELAEGELHSEAFQEFSTWLDGELEKLEIRFAARGTGRCPARFYFQGRR